MANDFPTKPNDSINAYDFGGQLLSSGLTKREYFAALNMAAMLSNPATSQYLNGWVAEKAVSDADALIEALNK